MGRWLAIALFTLFCGVSRADVAVPPLQARVTDLTGTLSDAQRSSLEQQLADFEKAKGSQIAVLLLPSTQPETIEQFGIRVADAWKLGRKGVDDGLILIVAKGDHQARWEVGYGLEGAFPDAIANRVLDEDILPRFHTGDFYGGIEAGVSRAISVINGEPLPAPPAAPARANQRWGGALIPLLMFGFVAGQFLSRIFGRVFGTGIFGLAFGAVAALLLGSVVFGVVAGLGAALFSLLLSFGHFQSGPGVGGPWLGGGGGFSGGGGGGFSGGGGGFGGGGASGSW